MTVELYFIFDPGLGLGMDDWKSGWKVWHIPQTSSSNPRGFRTFPYVPLHKAIDLKIHWPFCNLHCNFVIICILANILELKSGRCTAK